MKTSRSFSLALGALALGGGSVMLSFNVIFAVTLWSTPSPYKFHLIVIVASGLLLVTAILLLLLLGKQIQYRNGAHIKDFGHRRRHTYLLVGFDAVFGILSAGASVIILVLLEMKIDHIPKMILQSSTENFIVGGFIVWGVFSILHALFLICMVTTQRRDFQQQIQPYHTDLESSGPTEMQQNTGPASSIVRGSNDQRHNSVDSKNLSINRPQSCSSLRSSLSHIVRPISSKTRLISSPKQSQRPVSPDAGNRSTTVSIEDGFDAWDTSAVDTQSRQFVESASSTPQRFLETIPASPTGSRSPSPGFPLDLEPPRTRQRSRSYSPASFKEVHLHSRSTTPPDNAKETHIHPLFRTDSATPPPLATPGTIVTAAPGAGMVISDRNSIRSIRRIRSGSFPSSPLTHSSSLDSMRLAIERDDRGRQEDAGGERTLTPPIPDFVLASPKDLKQQKFVIEVEPSELISDVKEKISQEKGWEVSQQKLIYSGKILQDTNTVESYKIEEKGFIVCMTSKPKAAPASTSSSKPPSTPTPAISATPAPPAAPAQSASSSANAPPATPTPAVAGAFAISETLATPSQPSGLAMGVERAQQIAEMESMGFERLQIDRAMRAAYYNSERAIEYLLTGIPEDVQREEREVGIPQAAQAPQDTFTPPAPAASGEAGDEPVNLFEAAAQAGQAGRGGAARSGASSLFAAGGANLGSPPAGAAGLGNLDFLRNNPQFQQLRQVVQQNPQMLEPILQQVGAGNPQLAELIGQHPEQFLQILSEDGDNDAPLPPGAQQISVTEEERDAIERLCRLGFARDRAIQAYFACDKNEELAANFLFDQPEDED
ncbi:hypothetical protein B7494_g8104 [Chlorociboria aeruginascens]|nr:hypothetical protein B7494_g8104 [Chlorociboria aeruginascens]